MPKLLLMYSNHDPGPEHVAKLKELSRDIRVAVADSERRAVEEASDADVLLGHRYLFQALPRARLLPY